MLRYEFRRAADSGPWAAWAAERIKGCARGFGACVTMGVIGPEGLRAVLVFNDWNPEAGTMQVSAASNGKPWLSRSVLRAWHRYVFEEAGCQLAVVMTAPDNKPVRRGCKAFGYRETIVPRLRGREEDGVVLTLTDDDWKRSRFAKE